MKMTPNTKMRVSFTGYEAGAPRFMLIKILRTVFDLDLKEAKELMDSIITGEYKSVRAIINVYQYGQLRALLELGEHDDERLTNWMSVHSEELLEASSVPDLTVNYGVSSHE
jgi:hypothetical protein